MEIPEIFKDYVKPEPRSIKQNEDVVVLDKEIIISKKNALKDFETFKYLIDNVYSGRDYWEIHGVNFDECYAQIENKLDSCDYISTNEFAECIRNAFKGKILDNHLNIYVLSESSMKHFSFGGNKIAYFSGVTIERENNHFVVVDSEQQSVSIGDIIECDDNMLFKTLSPKGKEYFYIGKRSWDPLENITITVNSKEMTVPVHKCRAGDYKPTTDKQFELVDFDGIKVVKSGTYSKDDSAPIDIGEDIGKSIKNSTNVIWINASNPGGSSDYPMYFIKGLNDYANLANHTAVLETNISNNNPSFVGDAYTKWKFYTDDELDTSKGTFNGNLYTIMNSLTGSSSEMAVGYSKSVKNNILIGENSSGTGQFGELISFALPHSLIALTIPKKIFLNDIKEGEGYTPDYWVDSADLEGAVINWIKSTKDE